MAGGLTLQERRERWAAAREAFDGLGDELWRGGSAELEAVMGEIDGLVVRRGGRASRRHCRGDDAGRDRFGRTGTDAGAVGAAARPVAEVRGSSRRWWRWPRHSRWPATRRSRMPCCPACCPRAVPPSSCPRPTSCAPSSSTSAEPAVLEGLIKMAVREGPRGCRQLRPALLAAVRAATVQLQREQDRMKRFVALSQPQVDECGLAEYRLTLDVEGRAVLEAALGPLSAPQPIDGERDLRPSDQRRGEALVALVKRAVASAETTRPGAPRASCSSPSTSRPFATGSAVRARRSPAASRARCSRPRRCVGWPATPRSSRR